MQCHACCFKGEHAPVYAHVCVRLCVRARVHVWDVFHAHLISELSLDAISFLEVNFEKLSVLFKGPT